MDFYRVPQTVFSVVVPQGGLGLELHYVGGTASCEFTARETFQSDAGMLYVGIITGVLDEVMFWTVFMETNKIYTTLMIEVEFQRPVVCGKIYRNSGLLFRRPKTETTLPPGVLKMNRVNHAL